MANKTRLILVKIETSTNKHCSNDCQFMRVDGKHCLAFDCELEWDPKRKAHGYKRCSACKRFEQIPGIDFAIEEN